MREFFRGWRRKTGVVTLMIASVLMAGWVRSLIKTDGFLFEQQSLTSTLGVLFWERDSGRNSTATVACNTEIPFIDVANADPRSFDFLWHFVLLGIACGEYHPQIWGCFLGGPQADTTPEDYVVTFCRVPYATIVIPLTILLVYLLLYTQLCAIAQSTQIAFRTGVWKFYYVIREAWDE